MVNTEPDGVRYLTPIDGRALFPTEMFSAPDTDRYALDFKSRIFDGRYSLANYGFIPLFAPANPNYTYKNSKNAYDLNSILSPAHHESIRHILFLNAGHKFYSDYVYGDISYDIIEKSLTSELRDAVKMLRNYEGGSIRYDYLRVIQSLLVRDELKYLNSHYIISLANNQKDNDDTSYKTGNKTEDENESLDIINKNAINIHTEMNTKNETSLNFWRTLPGDVDKRLIVYDVNQTEYSSFISSDDTLHVGNLSTPSNKVAYGSGDVLLVGGSSVKLTSDENATVLSTEDTAKVFNLLGSRVEVTLKVTTDEEDNIESAPAPSVARSAYTVLSLDPSTAEDIGGESLLSRTTTATYNVNTNIDADLANKAFPNAILYVLNDDTILDYLLDKEQAALTFRDFTFSLFTNTTNNVVRWIPQHIVIVPTDKTEYVPFHAKSRMSTFGTRTLTFILHPSKRKQKNLIKEMRHLRYTPSDDAYTFNTGKFPESNYYRERTEQLPRKTSSIYKSLLVLRKLSGEYGTLPDRVPLFELFYRLTPSELQSLRLDLVSFNGYRDKLIRQKISSVVSIANLYPKMGTVLRKHFKLALLSSDSETYPILDHYKPIATMEYPAETPTVARVAEGIPITPTQTTATPASPGGGY